ncbi:MAG: hypothetical protein AB7H66_11360 [Hyphomonadaceae bacterium]
MTKLLLAAFAAALATSCATASPAPGAIGRLYHYVRSNQDGTLPEQIYQYRASATRLEVGKEVERCTNAAFVTADMDLARGQGVRFIGGRLNRDATQAPFAWLSYENGALHANVPQANVDERMTIAGEPYVLYDFDLSDLNARFAGRPAPEEDFRFAVALIWPVEGAERVLRDLGWANARFVEVEHRRDRGQARYVVSGGLNGELWLDPRQGHVLEARFAEPNHTEYADFHLELLSLHDGAADRWLEIRRAHWRDCP